MNGRCLAATRSSVHKVMRASCERRLTKLDFLHGGWPLWLLCWPQGTAANTCILPAAMLPGLCGCSFDGSIYETLLLMPKGACDSEPPFQIASRAHWAPVHQQLCCACLLSAMHDDERALLVKRSNTHLPHWLLRRSKLVDVEMTECPRS